MKSQKNTITRSRRLAWLGLGFAIASFIVAPAQQMELVILVCFCSLLCIVLSISFMITLIPYRRSLKSEDKPGKVFEIWFITGFILFIGAISFPSFIEDKTRAKVSRARSDMRDLAVALGTYHSDNHAYPPAMDENWMLVPPDEHGISSGYVSWSLTTPIALQTSLPYDPFNKEKTYRYATDFKNCWIMASHGKDLDADMKLELYPTFSNPDTRLTEFLAVPGNIEYDPTNGTVSSGDVFRTGP